MRPSGQVLRSHNSEESENTEKSETPTHIYQCNHKNRHRHCQQHRRGYTTSTTDTNQQSNFTQQTPQQEQLRQKQVQASYMRTYYVNNKQKWKKTITKEQTLTEEQKQHRREYAKKYRRENKELVRQSSATYRKKNKEAINDYNKKYREANREEINEMKRTRRVEYKTNARDKLLKEFRNKPILVRHFSNQTYKQKTDIEKALSITKPEDWYHVSRSQLRAMPQGKKILQVYGMADFLKVCLIHVTQLNFEGDVSRLQLDIRQVSYGA